MQKISIAASAKMLEIWQKKWGRKKKTLHVSIPFKVFFSFRMSVNESAYFPFMHLLKNLPGYQPFVPEQKTNKLNSEFIRFLFFFLADVWELKRKKVSDFSRRWRKFWILRVLCGDLTIQLWPAASSVRDAAVKPWVSSCSSLCVSIFTLSVWVYAPLTPKGCHHYTYTSDSYIMLTGL